MDIPGGKFIDDLTGQHFGGYELKELVATGGMASIYKGFDEALSRWVAIKVVPIQATGVAEETMLARFRLEAQAIAALRHRNILTIYGYGEEKGWAYIVMEYVPGGSLKDRIKLDQPFTWQQALTIIIPVSEALAFAHDRHIIHRDIKPANILMPAEDWPLLADFGLAKMEHSTRPNLTMPGQVLGTMAYAAPEQIQEGEIDTRVDIYSLGIVLYELLTGKLPFAGETTFDFLMARLTDPPAPLLKINPDAPPLFVPILDKALAQEPEDRYQTMIEFSGALKEAQRELTSLMTTTESVKAKRREPKVRLTVSPGGQEILISGQPELIIGRASKDKVPGIDLAPYGGSKAGVSRQHSRLVNQDNEWFIEDLSSTNGTFVNGIKLTPRQMVTLKNNDLIRCGQIELHFLIG
ncbi:MAG: protein kinase [Anaerolineae bacterium]|nr:protein kinase [Anaerolineae bacterium]